MAVLLLKETSVKIPEQCEVTLENKVFKFSGPLGSQEYDATKFNFTFSIVDGHIKIASWHGNRRKNNMLNTVASHLRNNANGVVTGFKYCIKAVYKHFSINMSVENSGKKVVVKNFLGSKVPREFEVLGKSVASIAENKDILVVEGINIEDVSQTAASIQNDCFKRKKNDIRIFLDGIFNIEKTTMIQ